MYDAASPAATSSRGAGTGVRRASPATAALPATSKNSDITAICPFRPLTPSPTVPAI
ncbi:hypothetical protein HEK616_58120 [Streptomyces nigrescens]|uniref:Uncharacterized protein n=1 Tax=Streptomyces nigrescens TaxID=1920 RepID=A0ABM8A137_STRNI|nr:hypothetical protein HEK616_58120 [Streptomyces nigrescens]